MEEELEKCADLDSRPFVRRVLYALLERRLAFRAQGRRPHLLVGLEDSLRYIF